MIKILMFALFPHFVKGSALIQNGCNCERKISPKDFIMFLPFQDLPQPEPHGANWSIGTVFFRMRKVSYAI